MCKGAKPFRLVDLYLILKVLLNIVIAKSNIDFKVALNKSISLSALQEMLDMMCPEAEVTE